MTAVLNPAQKTADVDAIRKLRVEPWEEPNRDHIAAAVERAALAGAAPPAEPREGEVRVDARGQP